MLDKKFIIKIGEEKIQKIKKEKSSNPQDVVSLWIEQDLMWNSENKFYVALESLANQIDIISDPREQFKKTKLAFMEYNLSTYQLFTVLMIHKEERGKCNFIFPYEHIKLEELENLLKHYSIYEQTLSKLEIGHDRSLSNAMIVTEKFCIFTLLKRVIMECLFNIGVNEHFLKEFNCKNIDELERKFGKQYLIEIRDFAKVLNNDGTINNELWSKLGNQNSSASQIMEINFLKKEI
jgi:hypothetical protein